jgi:hypothetical protein
MIINSGTGFVPHFEINNQKTLPRNLTEKVLSFTTKRTHEPLDGRNLSGESHPRQVRHPGASHSYQRSEGYRV